MSHNTVRVACYRGPGLLYDRVVKWWTKSEFSHTELLLGDADAHGFYEAGSASFRDRGVRTKLIKPSAAKWELIRLPELYRADDARRWFRANDGRSYDLLGQLGFVWGPAKEDPEKFWCSEADAAALGLVEPWRYSPGLFRAWALSVGVKESV